MAEVVRKECSSESTGSEGSKRRAEKPDDRDAICKPIGTHTDPYQSTYGHNTRDNKIHAIIKYSIK